MDSNIYASISLEDVDADTFILGEYTKTTISSKDKQNYQDAHKIHLNEMKSTKDREAAIVRDLLYVLDGKEGIYIKYTNEVDETNIYSNLKGNTYKVNKDIDISFKDIAKRLCHLGKHFSALDYFVNYFNKAQYGKVLTKLCEYIRNFLSEYELSICKFYELFDKDPNFSLISLYQLLNNVIESSNYPSITVSLHNIYDLTQLIVDDSQKRSNNSNLLDMKFENIMKSLKEDINTDKLDEVYLDSQNSEYVKGGVVLNMIYSQLEKFAGNDRSSNLFHDIYEFVSKDYISILNEWLQFGKISDPFNEFFIIEAIPNENNLSFDSYYWSNKYAIRREGLLKQFNSLDFQKQLFLTGKYLSILNECNSKDMVNTATFEPVKSLQDKNLDLIITQAYKRSNDLICQLLFTGYRLTEYVSLLNKYYLITDGSLFENFMNTSNHELKRSFHNSSTSNIKLSYNRAYEKENLNAVEKLILDLLEVRFEKHSLLEDILEIIKTQATDANEIFNASNLMKLNDLLKTNIQNNIRPNTNENLSETEGYRYNKLTISRFSIDIKIPFPLNQVILDSHKLEYQILFRHSALVKFLEKRFEKSWRELGYQTFWTWNFEDNRIRKWIKKCRFIHTKMYDFIRIYMFYSNYDVIEYNSNNIDFMLDKMSVKDKSFDLSRFKFQITEFLSSSMCELLLSQDNLACCLYELFTLIIVFHEYVMSLRKALLLMDEKLLNVYKERLNLSMKYSPEGKEEKINNLITVLDSYHLAFQKKLTHLCEYLAYYGEIDSPKLLLLHSKIISSFRI